MKLQLAEAEAEAARIETERRKAEEAERNRLEAERAKGIASGIDEVEITDLLQVPADLYEVKVNKAKVKAYLSKYGKVPGLRVTFKTKLTLNG